MVAHASTTAAAGEAAERAVDGQDSDGGPASRSWIVARSGELRAAVWVGGRAAIVQDVRTAVEAALR